MSETKTEGKSLSAKAEKSAKRRKANRRDLHSYIHGKIKQIDPKKQVSETAVNMLNGIAFGFLENVIDEARRFKQRENQSQTLTSRDLEFGMYYLYDANPTQQQFAKYAAQFGKTAVAKYKGSRGVSEKKKKQPSGSKKGSSSKKGAAAETAT